MIVDRNCHKSHHYGMVLSGAQPLYVEAFPMTEYSMYGAVPLRTIKKALLDLKAEGRLDRVQMLMLTNCTFDGHVYNTRRVMEECLAIKPDIIFLWDEAWFGFARLSPFLRPRTGMGARAALEEWRASPDALKAYQAQAAELGEDLDPKDPRLLERRLVPDPRKMRIRVYETDSVHKSMSCSAPGLDRGGARRGLQPARLGLPRSGVHPHHDLAERADHRLARRRPPPDGTRRLRAGHALDRDLAGDPPRGDRASDHLEVLPHARRRQMMPAEYPRLGLQGLPHAEAASWMTALKAVQEDEFFLDPTRMTLVCGSAGFDGTSFKGLLATKYDIQLNKTSRNSVLLQTNINNTRSDVALLIKVLLDISQAIEAQLAEGGDAERAAFAARVKSLMTDVPDLPNFSRFHDGFREDPGSITNEGDMRTPFFLAYDEDDCEYLPAA